MRWEEPTHQLISSAAQNELGSCNSAGGNAYGFNCDEQRQLRELRDLNQIPDAGLLSQLDSIRTETTFYIMGWGGLGNDNLGRASFMVHNNNCDKQPPVLGVAYFPTSLQSPSQGDAHILYPYTGNRSCTGVGESSAGVDPAGSPKLWARRLGSAPRVEAVLPSTPPAFYLKLSDNAPPQLVYGAWPPATSSDGADQEEVP